MDTLKRLHEHISAMLDGELSGHEAELALAALSEPEGRAAWYGYQAIGDALRSDAAGAELSAGFHARLAARLDMEVAPAAAVPAVEPGGLAAGLPAGLPGNGRAGAHAHPGHLGDIGGPASPVIDAGAASPASPLRRFSLPGQSAPAVVPEDGGQPALSGQPLQRSAAIQTAPPAPAGQSGHPAQSGPGNPSGAPGQAAESAATASAAGSPALAALSDTALPDH